MDLDLSPAGGTDSGSPATAPAAPLVGHTFQPAPAPRHRRSRPAHPEVGHPPATHLASDPNIPISHASIVDAVDKAWGAAVDAHAAIDAAMASNRERVEASAHNMQILAMLMNLVQWSEDGNPFPDGEHLATNLREWVEQILDTAHPEVQEEFQRRRDSGHPYLPTTYADVDRAVSDKILARARPNIPKTSAGPPEGQRPGVHIPTSPDNISRYGSSSIPKAHAVTDNADGLSESSSMVGRNLMEDEDLEYTSVGEMPLSDESDSDNEQIRALVATQYPPTTDESGDDDEVYIQDNISDNDSGYFNDNPDISSQSD